MLRTVSRLLTSLARQGDTVARWGGEEFVVVLPETDLDGARRFAERLRRTIEAHPVELREKAEWTKASHPRSLARKCKIGTADNQPLPIGQNGCYLA